jgi:hypothetical protein
MVLCGLGAQAAAQAPAVTSPTTAAASGDGATPPAFARWAILATPQVQESGLPDLLTVKLGAEPGLTLVERDEIAAVLKELTVDQAVGALDQALAPDAAGQRLKLGKLLKADALILLAEEQGPRSRDSGQSGGVQADVVPPSAAPGRLHDSQQFVRVVISDTAVGARLSTDFLPFAAGDMDKLAEQIVALVRDTRRRFPHGVQRIVGVPSFVSRDLTHDYDYLQDQLAYVLQSGLAAWPGQAVLEVEEARAIQRELDIAGDKLAQRVVPCFIEGEYRTTPANAATPQPGAVQASATPPAATTTSAPATSAALFAARRPAAIDLTLAAKDAGGVRETVQQHADTLEALAAWLQREAPQRLLGSAAAGGPALGEKEQLALLAAKAETFARLGDYAHSTALREACLLVCPDDRQQRRALVVEYAKLLEPDVFQHDDAAFEHWLRQGYTRWGLALEHLQYVVRNRMLTRLECARNLKELVEGMRAFCEWVKPWGHNAELIRRIDPELPARLAADVARAEAERRMFVLAIYPLAEELPRDDLAPDDQFDDILLQSAEWLGESCTGGFMYWPVGPMYQAPYNGDENDPEVYRIIHDAEVQRCGPRLWPTLLFSRNGADLDYIAEVFRAIARERPELYFNLPEAVVLGEVRSTGRPRGPEATLRRVPPDMLSTSFTDAEFEAFAGALSDSEFAPSRFLGRGARLVYDFAHHSARDAAAAEAAIAALQKLEDEFWRSQPPRKYLFPRMSMDFVYWWLRDAAGLPQPSPPTPSRPKLRDLPVLKLDARPIEFKWQDRDGHPAARPRCVTFGEERSVFCNLGLNTICCHAGLDVFWDQGGVVLHHTPGVLTPVLEKQGASMGLSDVSWDGRYVWVAEYRVGVHLVDSDTDRVIAHIDGADGLPPSDWALRLHGVDPGRALVVGSFGQEHRGWCALVEWRDGQTRVNVFHEATRVRRLDDPNWAAMCDPNVVFEPDHIFEYRPPNQPGKRLFVVSRRRSTGETAVSANNLVIDPMALTVQVLPLRHPELYGDYLSYLHNGGCLFRAYVPSNIPVVCIPAVGSRGTDGALWGSLPVSPFNLDDVLVYGGYVYICDERLERFDPQTGGAVAMTGPSDVEFRTWKNCQASMSLGLLMWKDGKAYQLTIEDPNALPGVLSGKQVFEVRDGQTGKPLAGVMLELDAGGQFSTDRTDDRGQCTVDVGATAPGWLAAYAWREGYGARELVLHNDAATRGDNGVHVVSLEPLTVVGGVVRTSAGQPLAGAQVFLVDARGVAPKDLVPVADQPDCPASGLCPYDYIAYTDAEGRWRDNLFPMSYDDLRLRVVHRSVPQSESGYRKLDAEQIRELRAGELVTTVRLTPASEPVR